MANEKKLVAEITDMEKDFPQWYTDVVKKAELADYSSLKGCMIIKPYGFAIWELMQRQMDDRIKATGHENVYLPLLIPESLLQKEKDHVEGFAPEVAWVTHGGENELPERVCVRPTSETLFCDHYAHIIQSYRDLPKLYNLWSGGKKPPAPSCVPPNFYGRKAILPMPPMKKARQKPLKCSMFMQSFAKMFWLCL